MTTRPPVSLAYVYRNKNSAEQSDLGFLKPFGTALENVRYVTKRNWIALYSISVRSLGSYVPCTSSISILFSGETFLRHISRRWLKRSERHRAPVKIIQPIRKPFTTRLSFSYARTTGRYYRSVNIGADYRPYPTAVVANFRCCHCSRCPRSANIRPSGGSIQHYVPAKGRHQLWFRSK